MSTFVRKFFFYNTFVLTGGFVAYMKFLDIKQQDSYKKTVVFRTAMERLRSHPGAIHFLGEPIEDGRLTVLNEEKKENNSEKYEIKVAVNGSKARGMMFFWLRRENGDEDASLYRIELLIDKIVKRLLIMDESSLPSASYSHPLLTHPTDEQQ